MLLATVLDYEENQKRVHGMPFQSITLVPRMSCRNFLLERAFTAQEGRNVQLIAAEIE